MYKRLVLSGGALKGIGYIGVLKFLEEKNIVENLNEYVGTSIGGFFALVLVLGYTYEDLLKIFKEFDAQTLIEYKISNLIEKFGLDDGVKLEEFIKVFLKNKGHDENITMNTLFKKTNKNLVFTSCHVNTKDTVFINHNTFPDLPVYLGARMSMNIPFIFSPAIYENNYYIDGCFTCNLPVFYFKEKNTEEDKILVIFLKDDLHTYKNIETIYDYFSTIPKCSFTTMEDKSINYCRNELKADILHLDIKITDLKFSMTKEQKLEIIDKSYDRCKEFLDKVKEK